MKNEETTTPEGGKKLWGSLTPEKQSDIIPRRIISDGDDDTVLPVKQFVMLSTVSFVPNAPENFEWPEGVSETVPDMSMSVQELFNKFASGGQVVGFNGQYYEDEFPDVSQLDLVELQELKEDTAREVKMYEAEIAKRQQEADDQAKIDAFEAQKTKVEVLTDDPKQ